MIDYTAKKHFLLEETNKYLNENFQFYIKIGIELEFYCANLSNDLISKIISELNKNSIFITEIKKEKGDNQWEIDLKYDDPTVIIPHIELAKKIIKNIVNDVDFSVLPFAGQPGNSMQFNISLHDLNERNIFFKKDTEINNYLSYSVGGLLKTLNESMIFFAPYEQSYARFNDNFEAPKKICWGGNNRTTVLRVLKGESGIRIEHRIPGSDCNTYMSAISIIYAIIYGIENKIKAPEQVYGNASDAQYQLDNIPSHYNESKKFFEKSNFEFFLLGYI